MTREVIRLGVKTQSLAELLPHTQSRMFVNKERQLNKDQPERGDNRTEISRMQNQLHALADAVALLPGYRPKHFQSENWLSFVTRHAV